MKNIKENNRSITILLSFILALIFFSQSFGLKIRERNNEIELKEFAKPELYINCANIAIEKIQGKIINSESWINFFN